MSDYKEDTKYETYMDSQCFKSQYYWSDGTPVEGVSIKFPTEISTVTGLQLTFENASDWDRYAEDGDKNGAKESNAVVVSIDGEIFKFKTSGNFISALREGKNED